MRGQTIKSARLLEYVQNRRSEGALLREIASELEIPLKTVHNWLYDPNREKAQARRDRYRGTCADCGVPTDGSNGPDRPSTRCRVCHNAKIAADARWTRATVVAAIREWADEHGTQPSARDWLQPRRVRGDTPPTKTVQRVFGSWSAAIAAAGFEPLTPGRRPRDRRAA